MPYRNDAAWVVDIRHIVQRITNDLADASYENFLRDSVLQRATFYHLIVLGESCRNLSDQFKLEHDNVSWVQIEEIGSKSLHEYFKIDLELVWVALTSDILELLPQLESIEQALTQTRITDC